MITEILIILLIASQLVFMWQVVNNYRNAYKKLNRSLKPYQPRCVVVIPCKGIDEAFDKNIQSFFNQAYENFRLWFVVEADDDPARPELERIIQANAELAVKLDVRILVAGKAVMCSQKLHNLVYAYKQIADDVEVLVFADSDACAGQEWLTHLVNPLRDERHGAASGYRWFIPGKNTLPTIALSAINSKICQMMGNTQFNLAWGGSMAVRVQTFKRLKIDELWSCSLSDDLALSRAVKADGKKMVYVPACMTATYETTTWEKLFEFARRQFVITRVYAFGMWLFGLFSAMFAVFGLWGGLGLAIWATMAGQDTLWLFWSLPGVFFLCQFARSVIRQKLAVLLLPADQAALAYVAVMDICFFWLWSILLLGIYITSAFGRTITWRNITYRLRSPKNIEILN